jgi:hypothetical protein
MMEDALAVGGHTEKIATRDIAELVAEGMVRKAVAAA